MITHTYSDAYCIIITYYFSGWPNVMNYDSRKDIKRRKFKELAERRTRLALKSIKLVGNLANRSHYEYTDEEVRKIIGALNTEVNTTRDKFFSSNKKQKVEFEL